jgi:hypothetical protein
MSDHDQPVAANLLSRQFRADGPNRRWIGDTTKFVIGGRSRSSVDGIQIAGNRSSASNCIAIDCWVANRTRSISSRPPSTRAPRAWTPHSLRGSIRGRRRYDINVYAGAGQEHRHASWCWRCRPTASCAMRRGWGRISLRAGMLKIIFTARQVRARSLLRFTGSSTSACAASFLLA